MCAGDGQLLFSWRAHAQTIVGKVARIDFLGESGVSVNQQFEFDLKLGQVIDLAVEGQLSGAVARGEYYFEVVDVDNSIVGAGD